jgi:hypothetical protein
MGTAANWRPIDGSPMVKGPDDASVFSCCVKSWLTTDRSVMGRMMRRSYRCCVKSWLTTDRSVMGSTGFCSR